MEQYEYLVAQLESLDSERLLEAIAGPIKNGLPPLHFIACLGDEDVLLDVIRRVPTAALAEVRNVDFLGEQLGAQMAVPGGRTLLHFACEFGLDAVVKALVESGFPATADHYGILPQDLTTHPDILRLLGLSERTDVNRSLTTRMREVAKEMAAAKAAKADSPEGGGGGGGGGGEGGGEGADSSGAADVVVLTPPCEGLMDVFREENAANPAVEASALVRGAVDFWHYRCGTEDDHGWGCAYRAVQTLWSNLRARLAPREIPEPPTIEAMQRALAGQKDSHFEPEDVGTHAGLSVLHCAMVLQLEPLSVSSLTDCVSSTSLPHVGAVAQVLWAHFREHGTPVLVDDTTWTFALCGIRRVQHAPVLPPTDAEAARELRVIPIGGLDDEMVAFTRRRIDDARSAGTTPPTADVPARDWTEPRVIEFLERAHALGRLEPTDPETLMRTEVLVFDPHWEGRVSAGDFVRREGRGAGWVNFVAFFRRQRSAEWRFAAPEITS